MLSVFELKIPLPENYKGDYLKVCLSSNKISPNTQIKGDCLKINLEIWGVTIIPPFPLTDFFGKIPFLLYSITWLIFGLT